MIGLTNPWVIIAFAVALGGSYSYGHHKGWWERDAEMQIVIAQKNEEARAKEQEMAKAVASKDEELRKANNEIDQKQAAMRRLASAGQLRLPAPSCVQASSNSSVASQPATDAAELERQTVEALIDIAAEGDRAISRLNACIATYNQVMEQINGNP